MPLALRGLIIEKLNEIEESKAKKAEVPPACSPFPFPFPHSLTFAIPRKGGRPGRGPEGIALHSAAPDCQHSSNPTAGPCARAVVRAAQGNGGSEGGAADFRRPNRLGSPQS
jgi:hypothetical protein